MAKYARIQDGIVVELIVLTDDLTPGKDVFTEEFAASLQSCSAQVDIGWTFNGKKFAAPVAPLITPALLIDYAANKRFQVETSGMMVNGAKVATDRASQALITGAFNYVRENPDVTIKFKTADGVFVVLTGAEMVAVANAVGAFVQACFAAEGEVCSQINSGSIKAFSEIDAFSWPQGDTVAP